MKHKSLLVLFLALLLVAPALAWISSTVSVGYLNHTVARVDANLSINVTFSGTANITIRYNNTNNATGVVRTLNTTTNLAVSPYRFQWNTSNGSFSDGRYNITIIVTNASNLSDNVTYYMHNITIDNTVPLAQNITARPAASVGSMNYTNATPTFTVNLSDPTAGIAVCSFARNNTDGFVEVEHDNTTLCTRQLSGVLDGTVLNVTFRAEDKAGNIGANATRMAYTVDDTPPFILITNLTQVFYRDGQTITLNTTIYDLGATVTNNTLCNITIDGASSGFSGGFNYSNLTTSCSGTITLGNPSSLADGAHIISISLRDAVGNLNTSTTPFMLDNAKPNITNITFSKRNAQNTTDPITITVELSDATNVSNVTLTNGTASLNFTLTSGNVVSGTWSVTFNGSEFNCLDERACALNITANDTIGNTNHTYYTGDLNAANQFLFIDSLPPRYSSNGTNSSTATVNQHVLFRANWTDISLLSNFNLQVLFEIYNYTLGSFQYQNSTVAYQGTLAANMTNYTIAVLGAYEGRELIGRISLNDTYNRTNTTANLTVTISNSTPTITSGTTNRSYISNNETLVLTMGDFGSGINLSSLSVNITGATNYSFNYSAAPSLFDCSCATCNSSTVNNTDTQMCAVRTDWPLGNITLLFTVFDYAGNNRSALYMYFSTNDRPDIVNLTINGWLLNATTPADLRINITNASTLVNFTWSLVSNFSLNTTTISFYNNSASQVTSSTTLPATVVYNMVAGKNVMRINATVNPTLFEDTLYLNVTANIPLNLTTFRTLYSSGHGLVVDFGVTNGTDITNTTDYINKTIDILLTVRNTTSPRSYTATINYSGLDGLSLRWNYSSNAFNFTMLPDLNPENITVYFAGRGLTTEFLDSQNVLVSVNLNFTPENKTFIFNNYLALPCASEPTAPIDAEDTCYTNTSAMTRVYLPYFRYDDEFRVVEPPSAIPTISNHLTSAYNQSTISIVIDAYSAFANTTFCNYNLSRFNTTTNLSLVYDQQSLLLTSFTLEGASWVYRKNVSGLADGQYNLSIQCADIYGSQANETFRFNITDITPPQISNVTSTGVGRRAATISGTASENVTFTVRYGTSSTSLANSASDNAFVMFNSIDLEDLDEDTTYFYNLTGCDNKGLCNTSGTGSFTTLEPSESSPTGTGGGGGGAATELPGAVEVTDSRVWGRIDPDQTVTYAPKSVAFSEVEMHFVNGTPSAKITIKQHKSKLPQLPTPPSTVYKYITVDHAGLEDVDKFIVTIKVSAKWFKENNVAFDDIALYRLENNTWVPYRMLKTGDTGIDIVYTAPVPGFSYFAIGRVSAPPTGTPTDVVETPVTPPAEAAPQTPAEPEDEAPAPFVSSKEKRSFRIPSWIFIILAILAVSGGSVVGLKQYKIYQDKESKRLEQVRVAGERKRAQQVSQQSAQRPADHDPMRQLFDYIQAQRAKGVPEDAIRDKLIHAGWDELVVHMEMMRK